MSSLAEFCVMQKSKRPRTNMEPLKDAILDCNLRCMVATEVDLTPDAFAVRELLKGWYQSDGRAKISIIAMLGFWV